MVSVGIILSSKYSEFEIFQQYGLVPPSFLPILGQRLYKKQFQYLNEFCSKIFLTIPLDYELTSVDKKELIQMGIRVIRCDPNITINYAILNVLSLDEIKNSSIVVLYGDTIIEEKIPINTVAICEKPKKYTWGRNEGIFRFEQSNNEKSEMVMAGLFCLRSTFLFRRSIHQSDGTILNALDIYGNYEEIQYKKVRNWNDLGHLETLQETKSFYLASRHFNKVFLTNLGVQKQSREIKKLKAEVTWYEKLPLEFSKYVPSLVSKSDNQYILEYISAPTVHDVLIYGNFNSEQWMSFFDKLKLFFNDALKIYDPNNCVSFIELIRNKTRDRCNSFLAENPTLKDFDNITLTKIFSSNNIEFLLEKINMEETKYLGLLHGDMCATNIFWDGATESLKLVDPRGDPTGQSTGIYGDIRYDVAKLYQSFILGYDLVLHGLNLDISSADGSQIFSFSKYCNIDFYSIFQSQLFSPLEICESEIVSISILLMMGLMPLHSDDINRQNKFVHIIVDMLRKIKT